MQMTPVEIGLFAIVAAVLILPLAVKKVQHNLELFLFIMGLCALGVSRSWPLGTVENVIRYPVISAVIIVALVAGAILRHQRLRLERVNDPQLRGVSLKAIFFSIVVVLGLSASFIAPIISFFLLVEIVNVLPLKRRTRMNLTILASLSIALGAGLTMMGGPLSAIAVPKMLGGLYSPTLLFLSALLEPYIVLWVFILGLISLFFTGEDVALIEISSLNGVGHLKSVLFLGARASLFLISLLLVGVAFGGNI